MGTVHGDGKWSLASQPCVNTSNKKATEDTECSAIGSGGIWDSSALAVRDHHTKTGCVSQRALRWWAAGYSRRKRSTSHCG